MKILVPAPAAVDQAEDLQPKFQTLNSFCPDQELFAKFSKVCPEAILPLFDPENQQWRRFFGQNSKELLALPELNGEFDLIYPSDSHHPKLEYAFFKGTVHAEKLIIIASGGFFDKHFALPYVLLLNRVLGFSCVVADYRGHENSWSTANKKNMLFRMRETTRFCGIDSSQFTFGDKEGKDFYHLATKLKREHPEISQIHGLGVCFGAIVLARAQNQYRKHYREDLFKSLMLISPLPSAHDLIANVMHDPRALAKFVNQKTVDRIQSWSLLKLVRLMLKIPGLELSVIWAIKRYCEINSFDSLYEFTKLRLPTLFIASEDSDYIVTKPMAMKVWDLIPSKKKQYLSSFGVEHLFNWREETGQLINLFEQFFLNYDQVLANPVAHLT